MAGCAEELDVVVESDEEILRIFGIKRVFRYIISFIDPPLGVFGEIFPSVMIISSGNISPNTPRSGSINDKYCKQSFGSVSPDPETDLSYLCNSKPNISTLIYSERLYID